MQKCPQLEQMTNTLARIDVAVLDIQSPRKAGKVGYMRAQYMTAIARHKRKCKICKANEAEAAKPAVVAETEEAVE